MRTEEEEGEIKAGGYSIFVDNSGSVGNCTSYWESVSEILTLYANTISNYYLWNSRCDIHSKKAFQDWVTSKRGTGGTSPEQVATEIARNEYENIILVTDGEVGDHQVHKCDSILEEAKQKQGFNIKKALCYVIGAYQEPNLSVSCPFTRFSESKVFSRQGSNPMKAVMNYTADDYKILDDLQEISLQNFEAKYETIEKLIIALNMGKEGNLPLKNQLVSLKTRLVKELSKKMRKGDFSGQLRAELEGQRVTKALAMIKDLSGQYFEASETAGLEKRMNYLVSLCGDMRGQYNLGQIRSNKMATAQSAVTGAVDQGLEVTDLSKNPIECPIIMDEAVPQILVDEGESFLLGVEKCIVDDINACPLRLLNYPSLKAKFKARLSNFTGVKYCDKLLKNPFTQNRLLGSIPLGCHKSHMTVGNHTIAKLVSGGKVMGNLNLYMAVIWILVSEDAIEYLKPIKANLGEHLTFRLRQTETMASMCGLSQFVSTQVSTDIALWFVANSGFLNNPVEKDTFRFHLYDMESIAKLLQLLQYPNHPDFQRHFLRTKALHYFLEHYKRCSQNQKKSFRNLFRGLYQKGFLVDTSKLQKEFKAVEVCSEFIPVDGPADQHQRQAVRNRLPAFCQGLDDGDLVHICSLLDETKQAHEIFLDYHEPVAELPESKVCWEYGLKAYELSVRVSPVTARPLATAGGQSWEEQAKAVFGLTDQKQLFKGCKYLQEFLTKHKKRPTKDELAIFYYNRYVESGKHESLPYLTEQWVEDLLVAYEPVFPEGYSMPAIIAALKESRNLQRRAELEAKQ